MLRLYHGKIPKVVSPRFTTLNWGRGDDEVCLYLGFPNINFQAHFRFKEVILSLTVYCLWEKQLNLLMNPPICGNCRKQKQEKTFKGSANFAFLNN